MGAGGHIPMLNAKSLKNRGCSGLLGSMRLNLEVLGFSVGVLGQRLGVLGLILWLWGQVKGWGVGSRGVGDESGGAGVIFQC